MVVRKKLDEEFSPYAKVLSREQPGFANYSRPARSAESLLHELQRATDAVDFAGERNPDLGTAARNQHSESKSCPGKNHHHLTIWRLSIFNKNFNSGDRLTSDSLRSIMVNEKQDSFIFSLSRQITLIYCRKISERSCVLLT